MPTYDFQCKACGHSFSVTTSWARKQETRCPACQSQELKELFGNYRVATGGLTVGGAGCGTAG